MTIERKESSAVPPAASMQHSGPGTAESPRTFLGLLRGAGGKIRDSCENFCTNDCDRSYVYIAPPIAGAAALAVLKAASGSNPLNTLRYAFAGSMVGLIVDVAVIGISINALLSRSIALHEARLDFAFSMLRVQAKEMEAEFRLSEQRAKILIEHPEMARHIYPEQKDYRGSQPYGLLTGDDRFRY